MQNDKLFLNTPLFGMSLYVSLMALSISLIYIIGDFVLGSPVPLHALVMGCMLLIIMLLENKIPFRKSWNEKSNDERNDTVYFIVIANLVPKLMAMVWAGVLLGSTLWLQQFFSVDSLWVHDWPIWAQVMLVLFSADFIRYWFHRWAHEVPLLWRLHEIHHSSKKMYWLATMRFHPLEKVLWLIPETVPMIILGISPEVLLIYYIYNSTNSVLQHSNINMKLGPLNYLISLQEYHFWHHSKVVEESNNNYGSNFIIWDTIFGTRFLPKESEVGVLGLYGDKFPNSFFRQMVRPFITKAIDYESEKPSFKAKMKI